MIIPDDKAKAKFSRAVLRVETRASCADRQIAVQLNGKPLETIEHEGTELFPPLAKNEGYPTGETLKFYAVPLGVLVPGRNKIDALAARAGERTGDCLQGRGFLASNDARFATVPVAGLSLGPPPCDVGPAICRPVSFASEEADGIVVLPAPLHPAACAHPASRRFVGSTFARLLTSAAGSLFIVIQRKK